ncbi:zinc finger protein 25-like [Protopterus annectens]|uniref:zinc finger protein 25-like n=1 Tax=Protopterus annectens TaxID=7888 RepID=UPI001CFA3E04|nr:zinc finger protein 25-like [Protopterus annectens]
MKLEMPESFKDVAIIFSSDERKLLTRDDKTLYRVVMEQNYENMVSIGYNIPREQLLELLLEKEECVCADFEGDKDPPTTKDLEEYEKKKACNPCNLYVIKAFNRETKKKTCVRFRAEIERETLNEHLKTLCKEVLDTAKV